MVKHFTAVSLFAAALLAIFNSRGPAIPVVGPASSPVRMRLQLLTEGFEPIPSGRAKLTAGATTKVLGANADGLTTELLTQTSAVVDLVAKTKQVPVGLALGQSVGPVVIPDLGLPPSSNGVVYYEYILSQPVLRPVTINSSFVKTYDDRDSYWSFFPANGGDTFTFAANVGSLSDKESLSRYLSYVGYVPPAGHSAPNAYFYALGIKVDQVESLGSNDTACFVISTGPLSLSAPPAVDLLYLAGSASDLGGSSISVGYVALTNGYTYIYLNGSLGAGTTLLMLRDGSSGASNSYDEHLATQPNFPPLSAALQSTSGEGFCTPDGSPNDPSTEGNPPPDPNNPAESCDPLPPIHPTSSSLCPPNFSASGPHELGLCEDHAVGTRVCVDGAGGGQTVSDSVTWDFSGSGQWKLSDSVTVTIGGRYQKTSGVAANFPIPPGQGKTCTDNSTGAVTKSGQCSQARARRVLITQKWTWDEEGYGHSRSGARWFIGCFDRHQYTGCVIETTYDVKCNRPCPQGTTEQP